MKCDEQQPVCQNCINSRRKCYRGIRLNFTLYLLYDPKPPASESWLVSAGNPDRHRILDQSLSVASLYRNGMMRYNSYKRLHSRQDLEDAERLLHQELQSQPTAAIQTYSAVPTQPQINLSFKQVTPEPHVDPWPYSMNMNDQTNFNFAENIILENYDIKSILLNPILHDQQLGVAMLGGLNSASNLSTNEQMLEGSLSTRFAVATEPEISTAPLDADNFVSLIHQEKYYWLLDIFNEMKIWKSFVPNYCVRLLQASEINESKMHLGFLFDCLILCKETTGLERILDVAKTQWELWKEFQTKDVTSSSYQKFERLLISIVLISMALLIQTSKPRFVQSALFKMLLTNQGRLAHKVIARYQRFSEAKFKRVLTPLLAAASFQGIIILRFFLKMRLQHLSRRVIRPIVDSNSSIHRPLEMHVSYLPGDFDVAEFFTLSEFELLHLENLFEDFDIPYGPSDSDSCKARKHLWEVVKLDYHESIVKHSPRMPQKAEPIAVNEKNIVVIPNAKCIALNLLVAYSDKFLNDEAVRLHARESVADLFSRIDSSFIPGDLKIKWRTYFGWAAD